MSAARIKLAADPEHRRVHATATLAGVQQSMEQPAERERRREHGRQLGLEHGGRNLEPAGTAQRAAIGRKASATKLAWCPIEYRTAYHVLRSKDVPAPDARQMILDLVAADQRRFFATGQLQESRR